MIKCLVLLVMIVSRSCYSADIGADVDLFVNEQLDLMKSTVQDEQKIKSYHNKVLRKEANIDLLDKSVNWGKRVNSSSDDVLKQSGLDAKQDLLLKEGLSKDADINPEKLDMFEKAKEIWKNPLGAIQMLTQCERKNGQRAQYQKKIIKKTRFDNTYAQAECEKPGNISCEDTLTVTCIKKGVCRYVQITRESFEGDIMFTEGKVILRNSSSYCSGDTNCCMTAHRAYINLDDITKIQSIKISHIKRESHISIFINGTEVYIANSL